MSDKTTLREKHEKAMFKEASKKWPQNMEVPVLIETINVCLDYIEQNFIEKEKVYHVAKNMLLEETNGEVKKLIVDQMRSEPPEPQTTPREKHFEPGQVVRKKDTGQLMTVHKIGEQPTGGIVCDFFDWRGEHHRVKFRNRALELVEAQIFIPRSPESDGSQIDSEKTIEQPPLGLKPKWIHDQQRQGEIMAAINRYLEAGKTPPKEWAIEFASYCG